MTPAITTVLVVDDEPDLQEVLQELLGEAGYRVLCAGNGIEALGLLRAPGQHVDVILLDLAMPVMDGEAPRWEQLADYMLTDIPVIILSAVADCPRAACKLRTEGCIQKPFTPAELLEELERVGSWR